MNRRTLLFSLISAIGVASMVVPQFWYHDNAGLPFRLVPSSIGELSIVPLPGLALPADLKVSDTLDWQAMTPHERTALYTAQFGFVMSVPSGDTYRFPIVREGRRIVVPVTTVNVSRLPAFHDNVIGGTILSFVTLLLCLITLWRGRDWTAWGLSLFGFSSLLNGWPGGLIPLSPLTNLIVLLGAIGLTNPLAYLGLYIMAETLTRPVLGSRLRWGFRITLALLLGIAVAGALSATFGTVYLGWPLGGWSAALWLVFVTANLLIIVLLFIAYRRFASAARLRLRWIMAATILAVGYQALNGFTSIQATLPGEISAILLAVIVYGGYLYAVLRHRLVDLSFVIDRTLVYGGTTMLVVGVLAAVNSLALRATLGEGAGLLLQVVVPLALGIVLGKVRTYMDRLVERVFFRAKYLSDKALRSFARHCGHFDQVQHLLDAAVDEVRKDTGSPAVALYEFADDRYRRVRQSGSPTYPEHIGTDDAALVAARAEHKAVDLSTFMSSLGQDGCVFPMTVLGVVRGVLVCANRPGEHYASDERKLISQVVRDVGAAWRILRARDNEDFVRAVARGALDPAAAQSRAQALEAAWVGA